MKGVGCAKGGVRVRNENMSASKESEKIVSKFDKNQHKIVQFVSIFHHFLIKERVKCHVKAFKVLLNEKGH